MPPIRLDAAGIINQFLVYQEKTKDGRGTREEGSGSKIDR
jgi:hypothetical protein